MKPELAGIIAIVAAMTVESFAQLFLKIGSAGGPAVLLSRFRQYAGRLPFGARPAAWIALGVAAYGLEVFLYTLALHFLDVSVAFPLGSLCFVGVTLLSKVVLGETVGRGRWLGIGLIFVGTVFVTL